MDQIADSILDALTDQVAVTDARGEIIYVNATWTDYARAHGNLPSNQIGIGANYLKVCERARATDPQVTQILEGLLAVLCGDRAYFASEYVCQLPNEAAWYFMWVTPMMVGDERGLAIVHRHNPFHHFSAQTEIQAQVTRELDTLPHFAKSATALTAKTFGLMPLREAAPAQFRKLTLHYNHLLELAVDRRTYKIEHPITEGLRQIANDLGFLKSTPRDVIEIHTAALNNIVAKVPLSRAQIYVDESRLMLIELIGYVLMYYRNFYSMHPRSEIENNLSSLDGVTS